MSKCAVGEKVDNAANDHEGGTVIAVFPTIDGSFRYAVDTKGYGTLQFFTEEKLVVHPCEAATATWKLMAARADVPRAPVRLGERAGRRRVSEAEHYFRC